MAKLVKVIKKGNTLEKLAQGLLKFNGEGGKVGHFSSQGIHHSGHTYPQLMSKHNTGNPEIKLPTRPVLDILFARHRRLNKPPIKSAIRAWFKRKLSEGSDNKLLNDIGAYLREEEKRIFGSASLAPNAVPPKAFNNPLIDTGDLRAKVAYKTSKNEQVKES